MKLNEWCHIINKLGLICLLALFVLPAQAAVFKCTINGKPSYSDKPCAENAESIDLNYHKPKQGEVQQQQQRTKRLKDDSRINYIQTLKQKNKRIESDIKRVTRQYEKDMAKYQENVYRYSDTHVATKEHGLFEKMERRRQKYEQSVAQLKQKIQRNEDEITRLSLSAEE